MDEKHAETRGLPHRVKVWDPFVRIFHWSTAIRKPLGLGMCLAQAPAQLQIALDLQKKGHRANHGNGNFDGKMEIDLASPEIAPDVVDEEERNSTQPPRRAPPNPSGEQANDPGTRSGLTSPLKSWSA